MRSYDRSLASLHPCICMSPEPRPRFARTPKTFDVCTVIATLGRPFFLHSSCSRAPKATKVRLAKSSRRRPVTLTLRKCLLPLWDIYIQYNRLSQKTPRRQVKHLSVSRAPHDPVPQLPSTAEALHQASRVRRERRGHHPRSALLLLRSGPGRRRVRSEFVAFDV